MNLEKMVTCVISSVVPRKKIAIYLFAGQTNDAAGKITPSYAEPFLTTAQVQLTDKQTLEHIDNANYTKIYKDFRIQSNTLTGLNRNLQTAGDYIKMDNLYYKIVAMPEQFEVGWTWVVGVQTNKLGGT